MLCEFKDKIFEYGKTVKTHTPITYDMKFSYIHSALFCFACFHEKMENLNCRTAEVAKIRKFFFSIC